MSRLTSASVPGSADPLLVQSPEIREMLAKRAALAYRIANYAATFGADDADKDSKLTAIAFALLGPATECDFASARWTLGRLMEMAAARFQIGLGSLQARRLAVGLGFVVQMKHPVDASPISFGPASQAPATVPLSSNVAALVQELLAESVPRGYGPASWTIPALCREAKRRLGADLLESDARGMAKAMGYDVAHKANGDAVIWARGNLQSAALRNEVRRVASELMTDAVNKALSVATDPKSLDEACHGVMFSVATCIAEFLVASGHAAPERLVGDLATTLRGSALTAVEEIRAARRS